MKKSFRFNKRIYITFALVIILIVYSYAQNNWIKVENIVIEVNELPNELNGLKIAHVSDLHMPNHASNVDNIIKKVEEQNPDIIVLTGDLFGKNANLETCGLIELSKGLSDIAKTYSVSGNHDLEQYEKWKSILINNDIEVIDNKIEVFTKNNKNIAIVGLKDGYEYQKDKLLDIDNYSNMPIILLLHRPSFFESNYSPNINIPDIVFSGHSHGGQFRIPFTNKGIISPDKGYFPKYTSGLYSNQNNRTKLIVSRGLGNSAIPIRIHNRPHLPIIKLLSKK